MSNQATRNTLLQVLHGT